MKVGITLPNLGPQATRKNVIQLATQAEEEGFDSLWTITRILRLLRPQTPYPASPDGSVPVEYRTVLDPLDVLVYVAANTRNSRNRYVLLYTYNACKKICYTRCFIKR